MKETDRIKVINIIGECIGRNQHLTIGHLAECILDDIVTLLDPPDKTPVMIPFEPKKENFIGDIKDKVGVFINGCKTLDKDQKLNLTQELGDNWHDERFVGVEQFFTYGIEFATAKWDRRNFELQELWREIAVNNSKVSNDPQEVADKVIESHNNNFKST